MREIYHLHLLMTPFCVWSALWGGEEKGVSAIPRDKKEEQSELCRELKDYTCAGVRLWLEGIRSTPEEIANACCFGENRTYMRDYIRNDREEITDIAFDSIKEDI